MDPAQLAILCRNALLNDVLPFWENHSVDGKHGGYFSCLDREGRVYDTDKFVWLQARQVWTFSFVCDKIEKRASWLKVAKHGADFLAKHGMDADGNWYFALDRGGRPLVQPCNIFSDCFAAMGFAQYAKVSGDANARRIASATYANILKRRDNPKGKYLKLVPGTRPLKGLSLPMILVNLAKQMEGTLSEDEIRRGEDACIGEIMDQFLDKDVLLMREAIRPDGSRCDSFDGRLRNPGHGIEAMWFVMDVARRRGDLALANRALDVVLATLEFGWDREYGGIYYFMDATGNPMDKLEHDQKLWWVHAEALVALAMGWSITNRPECRSWYERVHEYTWKRFPDPEHGEWFGYLNRRGEVSIPLKGGKWKGCFHIPRALYLCWKEFEGIKP